MMPWARFLFGLLIALTTAAHAVATEDWPNTPEWMLAFHGSAALIDWLLAMVCPLLLTGRRCMLMQALMLASITGNFAGWLAYMAYAPPSYYDLSMWGLTCAQFICLFLPGRHDAIDSWDALVRDRSRFGGGNNH